MPGSEQDPSARSPSIWRSARETSRGARARPSNHFPEHIDHGVDFLVLEVGIHRQRKYPLRLALRHRELTVAITEISTAAHDMDRPAVGNVAVDVTLGQPLQ